MNSLLEIEFKQIVEAGAAGVVVNAPDELSRAVACVKGVKSLQKQVNDSYGPIIEKAHKAHKEAIAQRDKYLVPLTKVEKTFKDAILTYTQRVEAEQRERERATNAELERLAKEKQDALLAQAATSGAWEAETLKEQAEAIVPDTVIIAKKVVEQPGLSIRQTWKARVIDLALVPREYLLVNEPLLNEAARKANGTPSTIPGVEFYPEQSAGVRI